MKPILFNGEMVQEILDGKKTQTRRVIKPHYRNDETGFQVCTNKATGERWVEKYDENEGSFDSPRYVLSPYQPGDILWVRETWMPETEQNIPTGGYIYKATDRPEADGDTLLRWRPSIHMPREAARIFLRVTDVRVEWVQEITPEDCIAEGIKGEVHRNDLARKTAYKMLWDSLNAKKQGYAWENNPFVWVYSFERIEKCEI